MLDRRGFLNCIACALLATARAAHAQQAAKVPHVGVLWLGSPSSTAPTNDAFRKGLRDLGWIEGQNIVIDYRFAEFKYDRLPELAAELVGLKVDVIVSPATPPTAAVKTATTTIPIVMVGVGDPIGSGFIASLARPGGNVTGLTYSGAGMDIYAKQLELLKETIPKIRRVAILSNPTNATHPVWMREINAAGKSLGVEIQPLEARDPDDIDRAFAAMAKEPPGALLVVADALFIRQRAQLANLALKNRVPLLGYREIVEAGGLMSYGPSLPDLGRRAATYVDKILKGAKPADLPVEQPTRLELFINLKTAKALGLTIPQSLLVRADEVIQ